MRCRFCEISENTKQPLLKSTLNTEKSLEVRRAWRWGECKYQGQATHCKTTHYKTTQTSSVASVTKIGYGTGTGTGTDTDTVARMSLG